MASSETVGIRACVEHDVKSKHTINPHKRRLARVIEINEISFRIPFTLLDYQTGANERKLTHPFCNRHEPSAG
jgi:hypothetical protein